MAVRLNRCLLISLFLTAILWSLGASGLIAAGGISNLRKGVVRINAISQIPDYSVPWNPGRITRGKGTGFLISGGRILTNAHVSSNARLITLEKEGDPRRYEARIRFIANDCDLAMLEVPDKSFFEGMTPLELGGVPSLDSTVVVLGYPIGGQRLSVTRGVVSRIDFQVYSHSSVDSHLAIQIDAAINPGNSGGPVVQDGKVVGVAFQGYSGNVAQNVGYMIPVPVLRRFLKDVEDGRYDRYVDLCIRQFPLLNEAHRRALGLGPGDHGVVVGSVLKSSASKDLLRVGDVLLSIDGLPIFSNGYVDMEGERLRMEEVVERKFKGDDVRLKILRQGREMEVNVPLSSTWPHLMQARRHGVKPRFVLFGGLVFQPLSHGLIRARNIKDINILYHYSHFVSEDIYLKRPEIVVLSRVLSDPANVYLKGFVNSIVDKINGRVIRTLEDVSAAFKDSADHYVINLLGRGRPVVLERRAVEEARDRILRGYGVLKEEYLGDSVVPDSWKGIAEGAGR